MKIALRMLNVLGSLILIAHTAACSTATPSGTRTAQSTIPDDDQNLQWAAQNPWGAVVFAVGCISVQADGTTVSTPPLPVGNGAHVECSTAVQPMLPVRDVLSDKGDPWCVSGKLLSGAPAGDSRLTIVVTSQLMGGIAWTLSGTVAPGQAPFGLQPVMNGFGGDEWPLWINASYAPVELRPNPTAISCESLFGA
jgi:hypothetical protein